MPTPLRVLIVEDVEDDADILALELERNGYALSYQRVETAPALEAALTHHTWDLVLSDYSLPRLNALDALKIVHRLQSELPFIIVSGTINDETAVAAMKAGAQDYVLKDKLARLVPAIERELQEAQVRRERNRAEEMLRQQAERERLVDRIAQRIRQSLDLQTILNTTVAEVRQFLQVDRVMVISQELDASNPIIAESVERSCVSCLEIPLHEPWFQNRLISYQQGLNEAVDDVENLPASDPNSIWMKQFGIQSRLVVPIISGDKFWGILSANQCSTTRHWEPFEVVLLEQLATQVAIAIQQSQLYQQTRHQFQREQALNRVIQAIRNSLDLSTIFTTATQEIGELLQVDQAKIVQYVSDKRHWLVLSEYSRKSDYCSSVGLKIPDAGNPLSAQLKQLQVVRLNDAVTCEDEINQALAQQFPGSWLLVPLQMGGSVWGSLSLMRRRPSNGWLDSDVELASAVSDQLAIAIQQSELHQQVQRLNVDLERQVQERTQQLQQSVEFEAALKRITDKVRDSLDERQILQTAVQELAYVLQVECCDAGIYNADFTTSTIAFEVTTSLPPAQGTVISIDSNREVYRQLLHSQTVQSCNVLCPIRPASNRQYATLACPVFDDQGTIGDLWLFKPKEFVFEELEIRLVQQVANQCAIGIRQSRLYQASQTQVADLETLHQLKDDFLSTVSHELRSPVTNMKMAIQMLEVALIRLSQSPELNQRIAETISTKLLHYVQILSSECDREISLINDLLDLQRLDANAQPLDIQPVDLNIWLPALVDSFLERASSRQQQLEIELTDVLPMITTDLTALNRILSELLNNACKYTPPQEKIVVTVSPLCDRIQIQVTNFGTEVPEHELPQIFQKFYRVPHGDRWKQGGTGLGLALVKKLTEHLGGTVEARSAKQQTTFTLQLPLS